MANPAMELRLEKFIDSVEVISNMSDLNNETPVVLRHQDPETDRVIAFVCSQVEPTRMVLPANIVWICFDRDSIFYKQALRRTSKTAGTHANFEQSWQLLYFYEEILDNQYYYPEDLAGIDDDPVAPATVAVRGIARLTTAPSAPQMNAPRIIGQGHYSLTNDRPPLAHSHPEKPARLLKTGNSQVTVQDQLAPAIGMSLVCDSHLTATWRRLVEADVNMGAV